MPTQSPPGLGPYEAAGERIQTDQCQAGLPLSWAIQKTEKQTQVSLTSHYPGLARKWGNLLYVEKYFILARSYEVPRGLLLHIYNRDVYI